MVNKSYGFAFSWREFVGAPDWTGGWEGGRLYDLKRNVNNSIFPYFLADLRVPNKLYHHKCNIYTFRSRFMGFILCFRDFTFAGIVEILTCFGVCQKLCDEKLENKMFPLFFRVFHGLHIRNRKFYTSMNSFTCRFYCFEGNYGMDSTPHAKGGRGA